jgi:hypothetical protein
VTSTAKAMLNWKLRKANFGFFGLFVFSVLVVLLVLVDTCAPVKAQNNTSLQNWQTVVAPKLAAGAVWNENLLPPPNTMVEWVRIPAWLAGHWRIDKARFVDGRTGKTAPEATNHEEDVFGWQQDKLGNYWHIIRSPVTDVTETDEFFSCFIHYRQSGRQLSSVQFELDGDNLEVRVSKRTGLILSVRKRHDLYRWFTKGREVRAEDDVTFADGNGSGTVKTRPQKVAEYVRQDFINGFSVRQSFIDFMQKNGLEPL